MDIDIDLLMISSKTIQQEYRDIIYIRNKLCDEISTAIKLIAQKKSIKISLTDYENRFTIVIGFKKIWVVEAVIELKLELLTEALQILISYIKED